MDIVNLWINGCKILINKDNPHTFRRRVVPIMACNDGFTMSVQASPAHYCEPKCDDGTMDYLDYDDTHIIHRKFEIGFPNMQEDLLMEYAEDEEHPCGTVYARVPLETILKVIDKHKGLNLKVMSKGKVQHGGTLGFDYKSDEDLLKRFKELIFIEVI